MHELQNLKSEYKAGESFTGLLYFIEAVTFIRIG
jgi:hypothetical protein